jgi:hypothetical protein
MFSTTRSLDRKQKVKVTTKIRVIEEVRKTPVAANERRARLQKFGNAIGVKVGSCQE